MALFTLKENQVIITQNAYVKKWIVCNLKKQTIYKVLNKIHDCIVLSIEGPNKRLLLSYQHQLWHESE